MEALPIAEMPQLSARNTVEKAFTGKYHIYKAAYTRMHMHTQTAYTYVHIHVYMLGHINAGKFNCLQHYMTNGSNCSSEC